MNPQLLSSDACSAWNPGIGTGIPHEFRGLETIFRSECVFSDREQVEEMGRLTGLPLEELTLFRPERLVLHELVVRVTADIGIREGEEEETYGRNFRRIAETIRSDYILPRMDAIEQCYADLARRADTVVREILAETLFRPSPPPARRRFPLNLWAQPKAPARASQSVQEDEYAVVSAYKAAGLAAEDPLRRAVFKSLYRVLGALWATRGGLGADQDLLATLVTQHVCNSYGSERLGQEIAPLVEAAIDGERFPRILARAAPILISLKGASASGKSSLRPMLTQIMRDKGIEPESYAIISPDVWRRLLLDYESLGPAYKYAGPFTSRELMVVDGKLDRYFRAKANRDQAIPHVLVDRFRFDSFASEQVAQVLHNTYAKYVDTLYMYFIITPPEQTVERGWQRALERGRYKAVEDFLGHSVEAYAGMPKLLFKWLAHRRPEFRYTFLDNRVAKGTFPKTIAFGNQTELTIYDPVALVDIERYQKININARSPDEVYPPAPTRAVAGNAGFLKECIRRIPQVNFVDRTGGGIYAKATNGVLEVVDSEAFERATKDEQTAAVFGEIAPQLVGDRRQFR